MELDYHLPTMVFVYRYYAKVLLQLSHKHMLMGFLHAEIT